MNPDCDGHWSKLCRTLKISAKRLSLVELTQKGLNTVSIRDSTPVFSGSAFVSGELEENIPSHDLTE
jgi:hypothetical protein